MACASLAVHLSHEEHQTRKKLHCHITLHFAKISPSLARFLLNMIFSGVLLEPGSIRESDVSTQLTEWIFH